MEKLKTSLLILGLCLLGTDMSAQLVSVRINLPSPPPPRAQVARPPCPSPDYIWRDGRWVWDDYVRDYVWSAGYWEYAAPRRCEAPNHYARRSKGRGNGHWKHRD
jgi:WXXGXW repeat (2 copies)